MFSDVFVMGRRGSLFKRALIEKRAYVECISAITFSRPSANDLNVLREGIGMLT